MPRKLFTADDGARLAYRDEGTGPAVIALAGLTRDSRDFDYMAHHLEDEIRLIRPDYRGRGGSDWTGADSYTVAREARDVVLLMDHLGLDRVAILGTSRGGLIGLVLAATVPDRIAGLCFNDVGPAVERAGLERIGTYIGVTPTVPTLADVTDRLPAANPGFSNVPELRWAEETIRHYTQHDGHVGLTYDPALRQSFDTAMAAAPVDLWPFYDALAGKPVCLIRGVNSDVLTQATADEMARRRPDLIRADIAERGHVPFLDETEALSAIRRWIAQLALHDAK